MIFYILLLRLSVFIVPGSVPENVHAGVLAEHLYHFFKPDSPGAHIFAFLLLLVQAMLLNALVIRHRLGHAPNLFPGVFYIMFCSAFPDFHTLSPVLLGNTFLIFALGELFKTYKNPQCADHIFNVGFWTGVASLFYFPFIFFVIGGLIGLGILRAFSIREQLILLFGAITPYFLAATYFFWHDQLGSFWQKQVSDNLRLFDFRFDFAQSEQLIKTGLLVLALLVMFLSMGAYKAKKVIQIQKKIDILLVSLFIGLLTFLFQAEVTMEHFLILAVPAGVLLAFNFSDMTKQWAESVHLILLLILLAIQYKPLLA
ncbi:MAG: hypothetical protein D6714_20665 [Bacteroidetes bacterium]|nr:MAG: hypothetical protein D6714_20665 [Bacteroidota bacterium]